ncbi:MAG: alpha/beta fold hydrolase [Nocardioidaceae bacterium]
MTEQQVHLPSGIDLCYEAFGAPTDPTILLVMGLGGPMTWWSTPFCTNLAGRGFQVVRYDNRDTGRSSKIRTARRVTRSQVISAFFGARKYTPYHLDDLAEDAFGLLDHLDTEQAHLVGVSMGGMIAQTMAIARSDRVLSLTSMLSTTGRRSVGWQDPRLLPMLLGPSRRNREEYVAGSFRIARAIGSPGYPPDRDELRRHAEETYDRGWSASGVVRQMLAIMAQPDRTPALHRLDLPTLVIHGLSDRLVNTSGGRATAQAIPGAELVLVPGMGHDLPAALDDTFCDAIVRTVRRASVRA